MIGAAGRSCAITSRSPRNPGIRLVGRKGTDPMDVKIKATVNFSVSDSSMEDALAEFDELTVEGLIREILDKSIACDDIGVKVVEGPNNLEEFDQLNT